MNIRNQTMGVGRGGRGAIPPWILKLLAKMVVFSILRGKKQISPLFPPWKKIWENPLLAPLEKIFPTPMNQTEMMKHK